MNYGMIGLNDRAGRSSPGNSVELALTDGLADFDIFVGLHGHVSLGVEFLGPLGVDLSRSFLFIVGSQLSRSSFTHL